MSLRSNLGFTVGVAEIHEPTTIKLRGERVLLNPGFVFTLKLFEGGKFRLRTEWHVDKADQAQPDFQKETTRLIQLHKELLIKSFERTRIRMQ